MNSDIDLGPYQPRELCRDVEWLREDFIQSTAYVVDTLRDFISPDAIRWILEEHTERYIAAVLRGDY